MLQHRTAATLTVSNLVFDSNDPLPVNPQQLQQLNVHVVQVEVVVPLIVPMMMNSYLHVAYTQMAARFGGLCDV